MILQQFYTMSRIGFKNDTSFFLTNRTAALMGLNHGTSNCISTVISNHIKDLLLSINMLSLIKYKQKPSVDYCTKYPAFTFDTYDDLSVTYMPPDIRKREGWTCNL